MSVRTIYSIAGLFVGAILDIVTNLLAAAIQRRTLADQFTNSAVFWLIALAICGLVLGYWLSGPVKVPLDPTAPKLSLANKGTVTITRLRALFSLGRLRGKGIHLSDILLIGSNLDIESDERSSQNS